MKSWQKSDFLVKSMWLSVFSCIYLFVLMFFISVHVCVAYVCVQVLSGMRNFLTQWCVCLWKNLVQPVGVLTQKAHKVDDKVVTNGYKCVLYRSDTGLT